MIRALLLALVFAAYDDTLERNRILVVIRASRRAGSFDHVQDTYQSIQESLPGSHILIFTDVAKNNLTLPHSVFKRSQIWYDKIIGQNIPQHHGDSWSRIEWRAGNCYDFIHILNILGWDFLDQYDLYVWIEDDVLIKQRFAEYIMLKNIEWKWDVLYGSHQRVANHLYPGGGFLAVAFKLQALREFHSSLKKYWTEDPIDSIFNRLAEKVKIRAVGPVVTHRNLPSTLPGCKGASAGCKFT